MTTALPCPFCGSTNVAVDEVDTPHVWAVVCYDCGCNGPIENGGGKSHTSVKAIELWNKALRKEP